MRVLDSQQMRDAERRTIEDVGIPSLVLMENAGREVVRALDAAFDSRGDLSVSVLCGRGNNGGDGFVAARLLAERDVDVGVYLLGTTAEVAGDALVTLQSLRQIGLDVIELDDEAAWDRVSADVLGRKVIVDALCGTGLRGPIRGLAATVIADLNASDRPVVAVDLPSGLSADTAEIPGPAVDATVTVTFGAPKLPLVLPPAASLAGKLVVADIGIPSVVIEDLDGPHVDVLTRREMAALIHPRDVGAHKGDFGRVLIVAGSPGHTGAASLAGMAALRSGAGLVTIGVPARSAPVVASLGAEYMTLALDEAHDGTLGEAAVEAILGFDADVIAIGPGLGRSRSVTRVVQEVVNAAPVTVVLDADALNALAGHLTALDAHRHPVVLTPHPGEMARLLGTSVAEVEANRLGGATAFARAHRVHLVLKGHRTIVATPEGRAGINMTGNPGMATAGAGDVLTGMIAAWCGQLRDVEAATRLAVYLHGAAGDRAAAAHGEVAMIARDIIDALGATVLDLTSPFATRDQA